MRRASPLEALRLHQWTKNTLVYLPLLAAHRMTEGDLLARATFMFGAFSLCASGLYIVNDLLDAEADRANPAKRQRPIAAGVLPVSTALAIAVSAFLLGFALLLFVPPLARLLLAIYIATALAYSVALKRVVLLDVFTLAGLYTVRIMAGGAAVGIMPSGWLLAFSIFLFLSLAFCKRVAELTRAQRRNAGTLIGRGYTAADRDQLNAFGVASGFLACLIIVLYVTNPQVSALYAQPQLLWLLCPILLYWVTHMWLLAYRGELDEDPVLFAVKDPTSYIVLVAGIAVLVSGHRGFRF